VAHLPLAKNADQQDAISLRRCEWMLTQRELSFIREDQIFTKIPNRGKKPDFYVMPAKGPDFLLEVESFREPTALDRMEADVMFVADSTPQKRIDRRVRAAAGQLAPYADLGIPLVILLDNHRQVGLEGLGLEAVAALFGGLDTNWNPDAPLVRGMRDYVSAVLVNEPATAYLADYGDEPFTIERPMRIRAVHHPHAATPLPLSVFAGNDDEQFVRDGPWRAIR
jgi:hypothetical protein